MKLTTKLFTLGALGAATYATVRALKSDRSKNVDSLFDASDVQDTTAIGDTDAIQEPMIITEEVVVITEEDPYDIDSLFAPEPSSKT